MEAFVKEAVAAHHDAAVALSDDLYANPEISGEEYRSSAKVVEMLKEAGFEVEYPFAGIPTAFRGTLRCGEGPAVGILVEYDALAVVGHGCGHNVSCAMSVLAALALNDIKDKIKGTLYVIGTPAEEEAGAKVPMANMGVFDDLALAVMVHCTSGGASTADMDALSLRHYVVNFKGVSAHAIAGPWEGHSAFAAARKFLDLIDARRECFTPDMRCNGIITQGGHQPNILPDTAEVRVEFRTQSLSRLEELDSIVIKCAKAACLALDCDFTYHKHFEDFYDMVRVPALEEAVYELLPEVGHSIAPVAPASGSSDMGNVSYRCPSVQPMMDICDSFCALHTIELRESTVTPRAHRAIADGGELIAGLVYRVFNDSDFRDKIKKSFDSSIKLKTNG